MKSTRKGRFAQRPGSVPALATTKELAQAGVKRVIVSHTRKAKR